MIRYWVYAAKGGGAAQGRTESMIARILADGAGWLEGQQNAILWVGLHGLLFAA